MTDIATVVATVLLIAFVIDRVIAALMFTTEYLSLLGRREPPKKSETELKRDAYGKRFVWFFIAAVLSALALRLFPELTRVQLGTIDPQWNWPLLWLILVGGADRISQFLATPAPRQPAAPSGSGEFHVEGTLTLDKETMNALPPQGRP